MSMYKNNNMPISNSFKCKTCHNPAFSTNVIENLMKTDEDKKTIMKIMENYECDKCTQNPVYNHIIGDSSVKGFTGKDAMVNFSFGSIKKVKKSKARKSAKKVKKSKVRKSNKKVKKSVKRTRVRRN